MDNQERIREHVEETLRSLELSAADLANHDCKGHPKITHERWLQCQHEIRAMLAGTPDPERDAAIRRNRVLAERMVERVRRFYREHERMGEMDELLDTLKNLTPHRLTRRGAARMAVRHEVDPLTGQLTGRRYVDPAIIAGLERQGYDPEPFVRALLEAEAEDD